MKIFRVQFLGGEFVVAAECPQEAVNIVNIEYCFYLDDESDDPDCCIDTGLETDCEPKILGGYKSWPEDRTEWYTSGSIPKIMCTWFNAKKDLPPCIPDFDISETVLTGKGICAYYHHKDKCWYSTETRRRIENVFWWLPIPKRLEQPFEQ